MARYLVTGAQGFLGRFLSAELIDFSPDAEVVGIGRSPELKGCFSYGLSFAKLDHALVPEIVTSRLSARFAYERLDILNLDSIARLLGDLQPDVIFHLASGHKHTQPDHVLSTATIGTYNLFEAIRRTAGFNPHVVLASSAGVYGRVSPECLPISEAAACSPMDLYSSCKMFSEQLAALSCGQRGLAVTVARIFNVCGPGQDDSHSVGRFVAQACSKQPLIRTWNLDATRDYIDVRDVAQAIVHLGCKVRTKAVVNIGSGIETPVQTLLEMVMRISGYNGNHETVAQEKTEAVPRQVADISRLVATGFRPSISLEKSVRDVIAAYSILST